MQTNKRIKIQSKLQPTHIHLLSFVLVFGLLGAIFLTASHAATPANTLEVESGIVSSAASSINDTTASASKAVKFGSGSTGVTRTTNCIPASTDTMTNTVSHLCGFPDTTNTGPHGTLNPSGSMTITQDGTVIQNLDINGTVDVLANNVTIKNSRITSGDYYPIRYFDNNNTGLLVEDTEIHSTATSVTAGISFANYKALRDNIYGSADGLKIEDNTDVEDSYIHDLATGGGNHSDGMQSTGGSNVIANHNTILNYGGNSCFIFGTENGNSSNVTIGNNLLDGGGWCIYLSGTGTNLNVIGNHFGRNSQYGPYDITANNVTASGNVWDDTGASANP